MKVYYDAGLKELAMRLTAALACAVTCEQHSNTKNGAAHTPRIADLTRRWGGSSEPPQPTGLLFVINR